MSEPTDEQEVEALLQKINRDLDAQRARMDRLMERHGLKPSTPAETTSVTIELTPDMIERINRCRDANEPLEDCVLDLMWLGALHVLRSREGGRGDD